MRIRVKTIRFIEFLAVGVVMGMAEDLIALYFATGEPITLKVVGVVLMVALPFAFISEYIVDHPKFWKAIFRLKEGQEFENDHNPKKEVSHDSWPPSS